MQTFWMDRKSICELNDQIIEFYKSSKNDGTSKIYAKYANYSRMACTFCCLLYTFCGFVTFVNPIGVKLITGKVVLPYGFKLPYLNELSVIGYVINLFHHGMQSFLTVVGFTYTDGLYAIFVMHVYCVFDVLILMLDELSENISRRGLKPHEIKQQLESIIQLHQKLLRLIFILNQDLHTNMTL